MFKKGINITKEQFQAKVAEVLANPTEGDEDAMENLDAIEISKINLSMMLSGMMLFKKLEHKLFDKEEGE